MRERNVKKQYIVIGLGRFGRSVAKQLEANNCMVMAVDREEKALNLVSDYVTRAICMDITDEDAAEELGLREFDGAIISMGHNLEAAVFAVIFAKEQGVKRVVAKAYNEMQGKILRKVGADEIVFPEREMGQHLANNLAFGNFLDAVELTSDYSVAEVSIQPDWVGKNLRDLGLRTKYQVNVIAIKQNEALEVPPSAERPLMEGDRVILIGKNEMLAKLGK